VRCRGQRCVANAHAGCTLTHHPLLLHADPRAAAGQHVARQPLDQGGPVHRQAGRAARRLRGRRAAAAAVAPVFACACGVGCTGASAWTNGSARVARRTTWCACTAPAMPAARVLQRHTRHVTHTHSSASSQLAGWVRCCGSRRATVASRRCTWEACTWRTVHARRLRLAPMQVRTCCCNARHTRLMRCNTHTGSTQGAAAGCTRPPQAAQGGCVRGARLVQPVTSRSWLDQSAALARGTTTHGCTKPRPPPPPALHLLPSQRPQTDDSSRNRWAHARPDRARTIACAC
jgi:hypothetical protein